MPRAVLGMGVFALLCLSGCGGTDSLTTSSSSGNNASNSSSSSSSSGTTAPDLVAGRTRYAEHCALCHGDGGEGGGFPALTGVCALTDCQDQAALAAYIETNMPLNPTTACVGDCARDVAAFIAAGLPVAPQVSDACGPEVTPAADVWRRLSHLQYRNTLSALLTEYFGAADAASIIDGAWEGFAQLPVEARPRPDEDLRGSYRRLEQSVYQTHVEAWFEISLGVAQQITWPNRIRTLVGNCVDSVAATESCVANFVADFGARALRRPLSAAEVIYYSELFGAYSAASYESYARVVAGLLNAPEFLYLIEHGQSEVGAAVPLSAFELAQRLSYHFWNSMPDAELRAAAANGSLLNEQVYRAQVERLFNDPRTRQTLRHFYSEWLKLENLADFSGDVHLPSYQTFAGDNLPSGRLHLDMREEVLDLMAYGTWEADFSLTEFFTTQLLFPTTEELAAIYQVPVQAIGEGVSAPGADRPGLLTRAAFLATRGVSTRPIQKGVFIRENLLCDDIPPPPDNAQADLPELPPYLSTREQVEAITEREGTACAFCHQNFINGLGFATENFDALGRLRSSELLVSDSGEILGHAVITTRTVPAVVNGDASEVGGAGELMQALTGSGKLEQCFARHYFRFSFARWEDEYNDACVLETLEHTLTRTGSVRETLKAVALTTAFRTKHFSSEAQ